MSRITREFDELAELDVNLGPTEKRGYGLMVALRPWAYWNIVLHENNMFHSEAGSHSKAGV